MNRLNSISDFSNLPRRQFLKTGIALGLSSAGFGNLNQLSAADAVPGIEIEISTAAENAELSMVFAGKSAADAKKWQQTFRTQLAELLGDIQTPGSWTVLEEAEQEFKEYTRHDLVLQARGVPSVPVYLLIPKGVTAKNPAPGIVAVHGHGKYGNHPIAGRSDIEGVAADIEKMNYDYGVQFAKRGYVVAAPCMIPFGRRLPKPYGTTDACAVTFVRMQALGQLSLAANLRDLRWAIDLLQRRPEVIDEKIGCAGLSYGGRMTMMVTAMDQRIKVAAVSGALNLLQERIQLRYSCGSQIIPGLLKYGDYSEIGSLIAPRPCVWETGLQDSLVVPGWSDVFKTRLRNIYQAFGVPGNLMYDIFEGGHRWNGDLAFPVFDRVLKG